MKISKACREAAAYLEQSKEAESDTYFGMCAALVKVGAAHEAHAYVHFVLTAGLPRRAGWYMRWENGTAADGLLLSPQEAKQRRILALLFCAHLAESEGL